MQTMSLDKFRDALERAAKIKGEPGMVAQKKLILDSYMIVDADGMAIDPENLDVHIRPAAPEMEEDAAKPEEGTEMNNEEITKSVRAAVAAELGGNATRNAIVAEPKAWETAKVFGKIKNFENKERAWRFGTWCLAAMGHKKSADFCSSNGLALRTKGHTEGINSAGGFLVPDEFENELITLREQYGVFRRNARVWPMASDTLRIPKRSSTLTAYFVGEAAAGTESQQVFDSIQLVAKKLMALTTVSSELLEDAVVNIGDDIAGEIAYAFAKKEDECGFLGDGTSTYGGIVGLANAIGSGGTSDSGETAVASVTLTDCREAVGKLAQWADTPNAKWFINRTIWNSLFLRLAEAAGGTTATEIRDADGGLSFYGYPVVLTQAITAASTGGDVLAYFGDMSLAAYLGDRRGLTVEFSNSALNAFEQDEIAVRGSERFDLNCANVGDASVAGAMIKFTL